MSEPYFASGSEAMLALAGMVDRAGLRNVLYALEAICNNRARTIELGSIKSPSAKAWRADALVCKHAATQIEVSK